MWIITFRASRLSVAKKEFVCRLAGRMRTGEATPARWLDSVLGETWQTFLSDRGLTLPGFGASIWSRNERWTFEFDPGRKLRALFGWYSSCRSPT